MHSMPAVFAQMMCPCQLSHCHFDSVLTCRHCMKTKTLMLHQPQVLHAFLQHLTEAITNYISFQIQSGAQVSLSAYWLIAWQTR